MDMHAPPGHLDMNHKCLSPLNESHAKMDFHKHQWETLALIAFEVLWL